MSEKGDGAKSLLALGLRSHTLKQNRNNKTYIIAIDEPEAHLHPEAIHEVKKLLNNIAQTDQIILATHNPIFVDLTCIENNIIVSKSGSAPAENLADVQKALGVRSYDNLVSPELVLLVEGWRDKKIMTHLLKHRSPELLRAINEHKLIVKEAGGCGFMTQEYTWYKSILCKVHCLFDDDQSSQAAIKALKKRDNESEKDIHIIPRKSKNEAEIEDIFHEKFTKSILLEEYDIIIDKQKKSKSKWSDRMRDILQNNGKSSDDSDIKKLKDYLVDRIISSQEEVISPNYQDLISNLIKALEIKLSPNSSNKIKSL